jgi:cyclic pyranopterin phosphate synthase
MPDAGVDWQPHDEILTFEELSRLVALFCGMGINKVRLTGGEPFVRRDCMSFIQHLKQDLGVPHLHLTTNGVETSKYLAKLESIGLSGLNVSLDTLSRNRFIKLTRRDHLGQVLHTIDEALRLGINLKINSVVTKSTTDDEIRSLAHLASHLPISLRFIEHMPFSGNTSTPVRQKEKLSLRIKRIFPDLKAILERGPATARSFSVAGFRGTIGIIEGKARKFCSRCNKVRITPAGVLKTCLYDDGVLDLKEMIRTGCSDRELEDVIRQAVRERYSDGKVTERNNTLQDQPSMASIGG